MTQNVNNWDRFEREANLMRDLEELGAVHLDRPRRIGFERRLTRSRTAAPRPTSPGSGGPVPDYDWMRESIAAKKWRVHRL